MKTYYRQHNVYYDGAPIFFTNILCGERPTEGGVKNCVTVNFINVSCKTISKIAIKVVGVVGRDEERNILPLILNKTFDVVECNKVGGCLYELDVEELQCVDFVWCSNVVFEDKTVWECPSDGNWNKIPKQKLLFTYLGEELYRQYKRDVLDTVWTWFVPEEYAEIRRCTCGSVNSRYAIRCRKCDSKLDYVFSSLDIGLLKKNYEVYKKAYDAAKHKENEAINTRCDDIQLLPDTTDVDPLELEMELRNLLLKRDRMLKEIGYVLFPDKNYSFIRKKEEKDSDMLERGCIPPDEQYSFWRHPKTKDTELLRIGYRPPDESHDRWYWPEERVR